MLPITSLNMNQARGGTISTHRKLTLTTEPNLWATKGFTHNSRDRHASWTLRSPTYKPGFSHTVLNTELSVTLCLPTCVCRLCTCACVCMHATKHVCTSPWPTFILVSRGIGKPFSLSSFPSKESAQIGTSLVLATLLPDSRQRKNKARTICTSSYAHAHAHTHHSRQLTFSVVWHWAHLCLKILAPFVALPAAMISASPIVSGEPKPRPKPWTGAAPTWLASLASRNLALLFPAKKMR